MGKCPGPGSYMHDVNNICDYYMCSATGRGYKLSCGTGMRWDQTKSQCVEMKGGDVCFVCSTSHSYHAYADNVCKYWRCDEWKKAYLMTCAAGNRWDRALQTCVAYSGTCPV